MDTTSTAAPPDRPWACPPDTVREALGTPDGGLPTDEAERRRERVGPNQLRDIEHRSVWAILWDQVKSLVMLLLLAAMVVSFLSGQAV